MADFRPQEWTWNAIVQYRLSLIGGVLFVVPCLLSGIWPDVRHRISKLVLAFLAVGLIAQIGAVHPPTGWDALDQLSRNIVVSLLAVTIVDTEDRLFWMLAMVATSLGVHCAKFGIGYLIRGGAELSNAGIGGMFGDNNDFALAAARIFFLLLASYQLVKYRWAKLGFLVVLPLTVLSIVSTFSRGGFLALASATLVYALLQKRRVMWVTALVAVTLIGVAVVPIPEQYTQRLETIWTYDTAEFQVGDEGVKVGDDSALGRLHYWHVALEMVAARPLGVGVKNYQRAYNRFDDTHGRYGRNRAVHNSHLQVLAEMGYLAFGVWIMLLFATATALLRARSASRLKNMTPESARFFFLTSNAVLASLTAFIVGGTFLAQSLNDLNWTTFALAASLDRLSLLAASAPKQQVV
ncbi:MAG TPA: O-antigen ligase family protein, partial [Vicinamibacterales bacterium]|nr:O-antigen ligase family protein [Vicinamibacterales bacterium]